MVIKAKELADKHGWYWTNQFDNDANAYVHEKTTGPELLESFQDEKLDHLFVAYGTGGTLNGVSKVLKDRSPSTKIHVVEPDNGKNGCLTRFLLHPRKYPLSRICDVPHQIISDSQHQCCTVTARARCR